MDKQLTETNNLDESLGDPRLALYARTSAPTLTSEPTKSELIASFTEAQAGFIDSLSKSIEYAFAMGDILIEIKRITPHGQFEEVLKCDLHGAFGVRHAQKLMRMSENKSLILETNQGGALTIDGALALIAEPKQIESKKTVVAKPAEIKDTTSLGKGALDDVIDGEFTEVKHDPVPKQEPKLLHDDEAAYTDEDFARDTLDDLIRENKQLEDDNNRMLAIFEDDDHTAAAIKEIDKLKEVIRVQETRINGLMNENAAAIGKINSLERRCKRLEKANVK